MHALIIHIFIFKNAMNISNCFHVIKKTKRQRWKTCVNEMQVPRIHNTSVSFIAIILMQYLFY